MPPVGLDGGARYPIHPNIDSKFVDIHLRFCSHRILGNPSKHARFVLGLEGLEFPDASSLDSPSNLRGTSETATVVLFPGNGIFRMAPGVCLIFCKCLRGRAQGVGTRAKTPTVLLAAI